ncbi:MAG: glycosyltransferase family 2 protein [Bacteroidetes bacterium]|nr:MAG: glycosyltransferase family 2 protein [Bacteroidota bacterium]REJ99673.1 MAG: glycosyltransferase family 2 protein [Bacteroidota bacterium]REK33906.1 MAG: glycosyltransferase family 2 protein [Bacteroidota bacterium]REK47671.1 MAG: glycosyltransferase family 2 protein [Bacteroidota bacterium]
MIQLSVICPVYNEKNYIEELIRSLLNSSPLEKEIILVDGGSTDGTREIITEWQSKHPEIILISNPLRYVSHGFNMAYRKSSGQFIAFIGAHAVYPSDYFVHALRYLKQEECEAVGGPLKQDGKSDMGKAIAYCMSSKFGVGDTEFRTSKEKKYVQSVAFAVYKREVFEKIGLMDEELIRNQDDEFHYRMNEKGLKILMVPEMQSTYYVRGSIKALFSQYYQYGYYKPLVLKKVKSGIRLRHLIPAGFVIYLLLLPFVFWYYLLFLPLAVYLSSLLIFSLRSDKHFSKALRIYPVLHFAYGLGFLKGLRWFFR